MNRVDRSQKFIDEGRSLVSDPVAAPPAPPKSLNLSDDDFVPQGLRAWAGRSSDGFHVQGLIDAEGTTYVTCVLNGVSETLEIPRAKAYDAFLHPFAYGFTLPL